jgi:IS30 family transposase
MKTTWKHLNIEQRKVISSALAHGRKLNDVASSLYLDPRSISREVKRNRVPVDYKNCDTSKCPKLKRWPFVCSNCQLRYSSKCPFVKFKYDAKIAQEQADIRLVKSRNGIDVDEAEFKQIDQIIKKGVQENKSIYQIKIENNDKINKSITTLYRYINKGLLSTKRYDLPFAVRYKKRKHNKKYDYPNNNIDRTNHTFLDYLSFVHKFPKAKVWQLDFLGAIKIDVNMILTFMLPDVHFTLLHLIKKPTSAKVVAFFDKLEEQIGTEQFKELFPAILTDRDPLFSDIEGICFSKITGEERCKLFYCDPYVSNQKPHVENMNKQIRKFFPKGKSIDKFTSKEITKKNLTLLNSPIRSLDGNTPIDAFKTVFGEELLYKIFDNL